MINRRHITTDLSSWRNGGVGGGGCGGGLGVGVCWPCLSVCLRVATPGQLNGFVLEIWYRTVIVKFVVKHFSNLFLTQP